MSLQLVYSLQVCGLKGKTEDLWSLDGGHPMPSAANHVDSGWLILLDIIHVTWLQHLSFTWPDVAWMATSFEYHTCFKAHKASGRAVKIDKLTEACRCMHAECDGQGRLRQAWSKGGGHLGMLRDKCLICPVDDAFIQEPATRWDGSEVWSSFLGASWERPTQEPPLRKTEGRGCLRSAVPSGQSCGFDRLVRPAGNTSLRPDVPPRGCNASRAGSLRDFGWSGHYFEHKRCHTASGLSISWKCF